MRVLRILGIVTVWIVACFAPAAPAEWQPADIRPTAQTLAAVLVANEAATGTPSAAFARRRERWTYRVSGRELPVTVAVRDDDYRATTIVGTAEYDAGRLHGMRWRSDANGIVHGLLADQQGDAIDRLPQSLFPLARAALSLAGETRDAWVLAYRPPGDPPSWLYVDKTSGLIQRERMREGRRVHTIAFDGFARVEGILRPQHWRVTDGDTRHDVDVAVTSAATASVDAAAVAIPTVERVFAPPAGAADPLPLASRFRGGEILLDTVVDGRHQWLELDTGTASITLDASVANRFGPLLEHAVVPQMSVGPLALDDVSVFVLGIGYRLPGILGYDFFFGHVVHVNYRKQSVDIYSHAAAAAIFADPATVVVPANVDQGLPLVHVAFGALASDAFAVDTGSPKLYALDPFARRYAREIGALWTPNGRAYVESYLEGSINVVPHQVADFSFGPYRFGQTTVGVSVSNGDPEMLGIPFDGIVGTDILRQFDLYFDYDNSRIGVRR